jgi:hypothetical protein
MDDDRKITVDNYPTDGQVRVTAWARYGDALSRVLTPDEARQLAAELLEAADKG